MSPALASPRRPVGGGCQFLARPKTRFLAASLAAVLCAVASFSMSAAAQTTEPVQSNAGCALEVGEDRTATRAIDGETLQLDGGTEVRLVGALAPRAFDAAVGATEWPLAEAARAELERLVAGRGIRLAFGGRRLDRHGRLLAHVFAGPEPERVWVQGEMLKRGLARAYALDGNSHCLTELIAHEAAAREAAVGLWADVAYAVRSADDTTALLRLAGTFQVVEGRIARASELKTTLYINFGEDWRQDFTVVLRGGARRAMTATGVTAEALQGRKVRARGWIERRGGPMIELSHPGVLEVLAPDPEAEAEPEARPRPRRRSRRAQ